MRRILVTLAATALAVPALAGVAAADAPEGGFTWNDNAKSQGSCVGVLSSRITQNGQHVGGNHGSPYDQTTEPGSRKAAVEAARTAC